MQVTLFLPKDIAEDSQAQKFSTAPRNSNNDNHHHHIITIIFNIIE